MAFRDAVRGIGMALGLKVAAGRFKRGIARDVVDEMEYRKAHGVSRREGRLWGWLAFLFVAVVVVACVVVAAWNG